MDFNETYTDTYLSYFRNSQNKLLDFGVKGMHSYWNDNDSAEFGIITHTKNF